MNILNILKNNPKQIFLIDALGALLTTFLLFGVLTRLEQYIGMPSKALYILAGIAFCLFIYSIICYRFIKSNWKPYLRIIIICNIIYSLISIGLVYLNYKTLTELGFVYFTLEITIIATIVIVEYKLYRKDKKMKKSAVNN